MATVDIESTGLNFRKNGLMLEALSDARVHRLGAGALCLKETKGRETTPARPNASP